MKRLVQSLFLLALIAETNVIMAGEGDVFTPYIYGGMRYESNLFRVDQDADVFSDTKKSDRITTLGVGLDVDFQYSRQQFEINAKVDDNNYDHYDRLDYRAHDIRAAWNWHFGNHFSGDIGYSTREYMQSFNDLNLATAVRGAIIEDSSLFSNFLWEFHPRWRARVGLQTNTHDYELDSQSGGDTETDRLLLSTIYSTPKGSRAELGLRQEHTVYPERAAGSTAGREYDQSNLFLNLNWPYSARSSFFINTWYADREYKQATDRDYNAFNYRLRYQLLPLKKLRLSFAFYQETLPRQSLVANEAESTGGSIIVEWSATSKVTVTSSIDMQNRKDLVSSSSSQANARDEDNQTFSVGVSYQPFISTSVDLSYSNQQRDSNQPLGDFDADIINLTITISM